MPKLRTITESLYVGPPFYGPKTQAQERIEAKVAAATEAPRDAIDRMVEMAMLVMSRVCPTWRNGRP
jgi:hypothetical protein